MNALLDEAAEAEVAAEEARTAIVISALRDDAASLVKSIVDCLNGDDQEAASDVVGNVRTLDAINRVLKYYGGGLVEVPDVWPSRRIQ